MGDLGGTRSADSGDARGAEKDQGLRLRSGGAAGGLQAAKVVGTLGVPTFAHVECGLHLGAIDMAMRSCEPFDVPVPADLKGVIERLGGQANTQGGEFAGDETAGRFV